MSTTKNEPLSMNHAAFLAHSMGSMLGACIIVSRTEDEAAKLDHEKECDRLPPITRFLDGRPTKGDLRKYVHACLKVMIEIVEEKSP